MFNIEHFYLSTPLKQPQYVKIQMSKIPQEFIEEYNLNTFEHKGWAYFEIRMGCYGIPQSDILANKQLQMRLEKWLLQSADNSRAMEAHMAIDPNLFDCR